MRLEHMGRIHVEPAPLVAVPEYMFTGARRTLSLSVSRQRGGLLADTPIRTAEAPQQTDPLLTARWYRRYVLGVLFVTYVLNVIDRSPVLAVSLQYIKKEFDASDTQLGLLTGIAFALFYSTVGFPIARWADRGNRRQRPGAGGRGVERHDGAVRGGREFRHALRDPRGDRGRRGRGQSAIALVDFGLFPEERAGEGVRDLCARRSVWIGPRQLRGGTEHSGVWLADDVHARGTAWPGRGSAGVAHGEGAAAWHGRQCVGRRPARRGARHAHALAVLWKVASFRHLSLAAGLHSVVWYASSAFNAAFLIRSHGFAAGEWATCSQFSPSSAASELPWRRGMRPPQRVEERLALVHVGPGIATLVMVPFQFGAYLVNDLTVAFPSFAVMMFLAAVFFGPSFAMTQALAPLKMRSVATSLLLFVQTLIGYGLGPLVAGRISDWLNPTYGTDSLRWALVAVGLVNIWAAAHYILGARTLRADLDRAGTVGAKEA